MKATIASKGTINKSSNNKMATIFWPCGWAISPRSPSNCITIAVEVSTKPAAPIKATCHVKPNNSPTPVNAVAQTTICNVPRPKISRLSPHKCEGCISRPITNRYMTIPNSAICKIDVESWKNAKPNGPMIKPAIK